jgi:pyruvate/2-oxoacid:ferredoxin oxidoreductase beta subunit
MKTVISPTPSSMVPIQSYLNDQARFPFCKGCGHNNVLRRLNESLVALQPAVHNVALVTDIGCIGLADNLFKDIHTVHTTHGRSTAFATGIALADSVLDSGKLKTIVLIGDGGAMIGLQHLVHAAMLNVDITVIICNNFVYGMTGGQGSGLAPECFVTATTPQGNIVPPVDLCEILRHSNAPWVGRTVATDQQFPALLKEAIDFPGFAVLEVLELCTEFAVPENELTGRKLLEIAEQNRWQLGLMKRDDNRRPFAERYRDISGKGTNGGGERDIKAKSVPPVMMRKPLSIVLAGSAGERIQSSAALVCQMALEEGIFVTQKNDNPVTQGSGFSLSELWFSPTPVGYSGIEEPDVVIVTSEDGFREIKNQGWLKRLGPHSVFYLDDSIKTESLDPRVRRVPFRTSFGPKGAALGALTFLADQKKIIEAERVFARVGQRYGQESERLLKKGMDTLSVMDGAI